MRRRVLPILLLTLACERGEEATPQAAAEAPPDAAAQVAALVLPGPHDVAVLDMGELGVIRIELLPELAPKTVARFSELADQGFYDGTYFHRVIPDFMLQGGDPNTKDLDPRNDGRGNADTRIADEFSDYPHLRGTLAMANTGYSNSASSQFFIVHQDTRSLDGQYSAFGRVVSGIEVVDAIAALEIDSFGRYGPPNRPYPVNATIETLRIERVKQRDSAAVAARSPTGSTDGARARDDSR
jgi:cyclophilin family peptidyl-prolyl cis-trans isomerase